MVKRIILNIVLLLFLTSCSILEENNNILDKKVGEPPERDYVDPYIDDNPITVGIYLNNNGKRTLITDYQSSFTKYQDIISLEVYYTKEDNLSGNQKELWNNYYKNYSNIDNYKIGYQISFKTEDNLIEKTILKPSDVESFFDYIQIYLYDDINQGNGYYSHITDSEITDKTILTSLKLTASTKIDEVISPIKITAFTYDDDGFNENGTYRGNSKYEVVITKK